MCCYTENGYWNIEMKVKDLISVIVFMIRLFPTMDLRLMQATLFRLFLRPYRQKSVQFYDFFLNLYAKQKQYKCKY